MIQALLVMAAFGCAAASAQVVATLSVVERSGNARVGAAVRGGVPFARGALPEGTPARLVDGADNEVPCSTRPIARWYDGSVKWLLVDALVDVPAGGQVSLRLQTGSAPAEVGPRLEVTETAEGIDIDTGPSRFVFPRSEFGLPGSAWTDLDGDGRWDSRVCSGGSEFTCDVQAESPGPPQEENWLREAPVAPTERFATAPGEHETLLESANAVRAVVKLSGWLVNSQGRRLIRYTIRAHACAGRSDLRIVHTFVYAGRPKQDFIRAMTLHFGGLASPGVDWELGGETAHFGRLEPGGRVSLVEVGPEKIYHLAPYTQDKSVQYRVVQQSGTGDRQLAEGKEAAGWAQVGTQSFSARVAVRNFWQMHPKQLTVDASGLSLGLWPELGNRVLDLRRRSDEINNVTHYDLSLWPYGGEGVAVTHEMCLEYGPTPERAAAEVLAEANDPLRLECSPRWYAASGAFGPISPADPAAYPLLEGQLCVDLEWIRHNQRAFHWDGMIDYGDTLFHGYATPSHYGYVAPDAWCSRGYVGWLCNDGTLTHSLFLHYLRTGDNEAFRTAEAMARHVMDVDTCHWCADDPSYVGGGHRHDQQHWGNGVRGYGTATHGAVDYYLLTGDERALDVAGVYARFHTDGNMGENEDRVGGLIRYWEITGDPQWKATADRVLAQELAVPEDRGWRFATAQHFRFVSNTSASLVSYLHSAPPEDLAGLRRAVLESVDFRLPAFMSSWDDAGYLPITLVALAYDITGEPRYIEALAALLQRSQTVPRTFEVPADYSAVLRALDFPGMLAVARQWGVNNIYMANIHQMCSYPYAIAALERAGLDEQAAWAVQRVEYSPPAFEEVIDPARMNAELGHAYTAGLDHGCPSDVAGGRSELLLLEDGRPLGPAHSAHADIREQGGGRYSHWGARSLWFSSSDNSDPRTNGREYRAVYPGPGR